MCIAASRAVCTVRRGRPFRAGNAECARPRVYACVQGGLTDRRMPSTCPAPTSIGFRGCPHRRKGRTSRGRRIAVPTRPCGKVRKGHQHAKKWRVSMRGGSVAVVGGSIAGCAAALAASRGGAERITVFERADARLRDRSGHRCPRRPVRRTARRRLHGGRDAVGAAEPQGVERARRRRRARQSHRHPAVPLPGLQLGFAVERVAPPGARDRHLPGRRQGGSGGAGRRRGHGTSRRRRAGTLRPGHRRRRLPLRRP